MAETYQWAIAGLMGISIAIFLAWFNKSGSDFKEGFNGRTKRIKEKK